MKETSKYGKTKGAGQNPSSMELLAPAGSLQAFEAAVEAGADAVYIGAPELNARNLARHFSLAEIAAMVNHAHQRGVRVYVAMNSLAKEEELKAALDALSFFDLVGIDALIVQDMGIASLARQFFPSLPLHASTLMTAHNSQSVRIFAQLGFKRVVLARELTLREIARIAADSPVELEAFVHGAMCFSYSGLCLFSSFLGGKSGLRGRCVQPCRRRYATKGVKGGGYLFSMHDLKGISLLPRLQKAGIHTLKIEGRMRPAAYVEQTVRAYRMALDAPDDPETLRQAGELLEKALGRKASTGFFLQAQPKNLLSPHHSGNTGIFLGKIEAVKEQLVRLRLRHSVSRGDRLRCHQEKSGERSAFTVKELAVGGKTALAGTTGQTVLLQVPGKAAKGDSLFLVESVSNRQKEAGKRTIRPEKFVGRVSRLQRKIDSTRLLQQFYRRLQAVGESGVRSQKSPLPRRSAGRGQRKKAQWPYYLRTDDPAALEQRLEPRPLGYMLVLTQETYRQAGRVKTPGARQQLIWALPPIISEEDLSFYRQAIPDLLDKGFLQWQISHAGQLLFFQDLGGKQPVLFGHYTLNVLNSATFYALQDLGLRYIESSLETDRENLFALCKSIGGGTGMTIYGMPPLFTARLQDKSFPFGREIVSPKRERFRINRLFGQTVVTSTVPFCLLDRREEMAAAGLSFFVVDVCGMRLTRRDWQELNRLLRGGGCDVHSVSRFNYAGRLQ